MDGGRGGGGGGQKAIYARKWLDSGVKLRGGRGGGGQKAIYI